MQDLRVTQGSGLRNEVKGIHGGSNGWILRRYVGEITLDLKNERLY